MPKPPKAPAYMRRHMKEKPIRLDPGLLLGSKNIVWDENEYTITFAGGRTAQMSLPKLIELLMQQNAFYRKCLYMVGSLQILTAAYTLWVFFSLR